MNCINHLLYPKQKIISDTEIKNKSTNPNNQTNKINPIITFKDTVSFTINITEGYVINISNDYSILVASKLPFIDSPLYRFIIKFNNLNTPDILGRYDERGVANMLQKVLANLLLNKVVTLSNLKFNKYNVIYADVYVKNLCVNNWIIEERYAVHESHIRPKNWLDFKLNGNR
jgi:hypothetical protein